MYGFDNFCQNTEIGSLFLSNFMFQLLGIIFVQTVEKILLHYGFTVFTKN